MKRSWLVTLCLCASIAGVAAPAAAQYFGRNKVQYRTFDFQILKTEHFDLYYYPEEKEAAEIVARMAERWQTRLSRFFGHELRGRQPVILYATAGHFRQTNAIEGLIGEGTGGVTEPAKRRVVLPMAGSLAETDHVLGHELVHAFQFDLTGSDPRDHATDAPGILDFPLWYVEGMAEYLSLGPIDGQTAMWMRDAALHEKLPSIKELDDPKYFPYRWGHAFWAYIGAKYGDRTVASLIRSAANPRIDLIGLARQLGTDPDALTADWHAAIRESTLAIAPDDSALMSQPRLVVGRETGGRYNVGPKVSPDGRQVAFFSERDRFSVELFLADVDSGRIERKLIKSATDPHFDSLEFIDSAGTWSPDGRTIVIAAVRGSGPVLVFIDAANGSVKRELRVRGLDELINPSFAPDGKSLVVSGNKGGLIDLYRVQVDTGAAEQLTSDPFADLEPVFTPDGQSIVFVTERFSTDLVRLEPGPLRLARLDLASKRVRPISAFLTGKHLSPQVSADGRTLTFIAAPDGVSGLYRMPIDGGPTERLLTTPTGVAGITTTSPALSAASTGRLVFSLFDDGGHSIYVLDPERTIALVPPDVSVVGAVLPGRSLPGGDVYQYLTDTGRGLPPVALADATSQPYNQKLALDFLSQPTVSVGVDAFGTTIGGGMSASFSDMLGDRSLGVSAQASGGVADIGGQLTYVNRKHRWNWATSISAIPYRVGYITRHDDLSTGQTTITQTIQRQPTRGLFGVAAFPFNSATRFELSGGGEALSFTNEVRTSIYATTSRTLLSTTDVHSQLASSLYIGQVSAAIVHDTSLFGATGPVYGARYRVELGQTEGSLNFNTVSLDWRRYVMPFRPVTLAFRAAHFGRYGTDGESSRLISLYAGYPEYVHGYGVGSFTATDCLDGLPGQECDVFRSLLGSRLLVTNFEARAPLVGLFKGDLQYGRFPVDVAAFTDAGVTWTRDDLPAFASGSRKVVRSVGGAVRVNVLGVFAVELSAAHPFDRVNRSLQWQVGIRQGF